MKLTEGVILLRSISSRQIGSKSVTLSKAIIRATKQLGLSQAKLADVLGVSPATVSRLYSGNYLLTPEKKKEWELAVLFVRLFRSLEDIVGGAGEEARLWLNSKNSALSGQSPVDLMASTAGLVRIVMYLETRRSK